ncbi:hypothetical protein SEA_BENCZKOWSKI14_1 [Gordonia phage Benczkowski14]|uniref:Uncharacterized protein n=2 Tax=Demosthenesvirus katyusha TaxID=1982108 RepID=A0A142KC78_9CAUD|nr:hypothetical protein FDH67_gp01 [Gordonia phage Katyusha]AMS03394.1 hypothetical protein SEA_KATYUSHA_1 [Gordonia phage Katyusha]AMS03711.1 hypothetical protein SEA_BENCZKOWSKI14_1 [Gordonia phage Benczkowski14]
MSDDDDDFILGGKTVRSDSRMPPGQSLAIPSLDDDDDDFRLGASWLDGGEKLDAVITGARSGNPIILPVGQPTQLQPFKFEPDPVTKATEPSGAPIAYFRVYYIWPSVHGSMQPTLKKEVMCSDPDEVEDKFFELITKSIEDSRLGKNTITTDDLEIETIEAVHIDSTTTVVYDDEADDPYNPEPPEDHEHVHWAPTTPNVTRPTLTAQMRHHGVTMATSPISPSQGVYQQLGTTWSSTPPGKEDKSDEIESLSEAYKRLVESGTVTGQEILKSVQEQVREQVEAQLIDGPGETKMFVGKEVKGMLEPDPVEEVPVKEAKDNKSRILNFFRNERLNSTMTAFEAEQKLGYHYPI